MWGKGSPRAPLVGMQAGAGTVENIVEGPQKIKNRKTVLSGNLTSGYLSEGAETSIWKRYPHPMFTDALFSTAKTGNNLSVH